MATKVEAFLWPIHNSRIKNPGGKKPGWLVWFGRHWPDNAVTTLSSGRNAICFCPNFWTCLNCQFRPQFCGLHAKRNDHFGSKANHTFFELLFQHLWGLRNETMGYRLVHAHDIGNIDLDLHYCQIILFFLTSCPTFRNPDFEFRRNSSGESPARKITVEKTTKTATGANFGVEKMPFHTLLPLFWAISALGNGGRDVLVKQHDMP